jgi:integrase
LFGLLASTGLRISEALRLTIHDIDWDQARLKVRESKFKGSRLLPLHDSTVKALREYSQFRRRYHGAIQSESFFVTERATPLKYWRTIMAFSRLRQSLHWDRLDPRPRIHDLRHTFAVRCLLRWYQNGENVDQKILALQTYLGHKKITDTYWYLTAVPDLMAQGASRFERFVRKEGAASRK